MTVLAESAVRIIVLAAAVAAGLRVLRVTSPRVAHHAWTGVCVLMLLLPAIVAWAPEALVPILPPQVSPAVVGAPAPASLAVVEPPSIHRAIDPGVVSQPITWQLVAGGVYASGVVLLLANLALGWWQARTMMRQATPVRGRLTHPRCVTPITLGLWKPVIILPPDWIEWDEPALAAVLAHEEEHVRRRDPLIAFITLINRAVFWFHPLAWWLRREISALSEQACDAAVVSRGHDEARYAAVLLQFARAASSMGGRIAPLGTAMPGAGLARRLRMLETSSVLAPSTVRTAWIAAAYLMAVAVCVGATPARPQVQAEGVPASAALRTYSSEHFEIVYDTGQEDRVADVAREAEAAYSRLMTSLRYDLTQRVRVILAGPVSASNAADLARSSGAVTPAIVLSMSDRRQGALLHELAHAFTLEIAPNVHRTAPWLAEGFAEHTRGLWDPADLASIRRALQSDAIPAVAVMADAHWGQLLFDFIVAQSGEEGVRRFFFALRSRTEVGAAIQTALGVSPAAFGQAFAGYAKDRFGAR
jgi:hypothetical protein